MNKQIQDLTDKELMEDIEYWLYQTQLRASPVADECFGILKKYLPELKKRLNMEV